MSTVIKVAGRSFALAFTLDAMAAMARTIDQFDLSKVSDYVRDPARLPDILAALAQQGELLEGRALDVDRAWFGSHISPAPLRIAKLQISVLAALSEGMSMETEEEDAAAEHDVVLDDIKKKDAPGA